MNIIHIQSEPFSNILLSRCFYKSHWFVSEPPRAMSALFGDMRHTVMIKLWNFIYAQAK